MQAKAYISRQLNRRENRFIGFGIDKSQIIQIAERTSIAAKAWLWDIAAVIRENQFLDRYFPRFNAPFSIACSSRSSTSAAKSSISQTRLANPACMAGVWWTRQLVGRASGRRTSPN